MSESNLLAYRCKFCGTNGVAECADDCPELDKAKWQAMLCCDRCGAYQRWLRRMFDRVSQWSRDWAIRSERDREASKTTVAQNVEKHTRKIAEVMCRFYRVDFTWQPEIVSELLTHPHLSFTIIRAFERHVKDLAHQRRRDRTAATVAPE